MSTLSTPSFESALAKPSHILSTPYNHPIFRYLLFRSRSTLVSIYCFYLFRHFNSLIFWSPTLLPLCPMHSVLTTVPNPLDTDFPIPQHSGISKFTKKVPRKPSRGGALEEYLGFLNLIDIYFNFLTRNITKTFGNT
ncbi:hypothetical protein BMS3Bbin07_00451 [bacterium BMS3Bbin07]|nr:hypothetical protein BMS3Bbin07_00451 [bacterium BMS3Bbin07]